MRIILFSVLWAVSLVSMAAGIHKWVDPDGGVHYGDRPPSSVEAERVTVGRVNAIDSGVDQSALVDRVDKTVGVNQRKRRIILLNVKIDGLKSRRDKEIARLRYSMRFSANNLGGAIRDQQLAQQMQVVNDRYRSEIQDVQIDINQLQREIREIGQ
ncbi:DUF4124 domain-containing protein [Sedimenticola hydrogenitrophicus]|uniref:DUF4124 domain-containing protein n=1 Tax=Sedimenticola hydrogenitrophicus TaxID=2967975 RepID=UPI0021A6063F|nr:DUF4124 domain-containing protein [Sedimenticola hydrogenitrophicus]